MKNYQKIHIWDLPTDKVYIKFNKAFSERFFGLAHQKFGTYKLIGEFLNVKRGDTTIAKNWKKGEVCYPLNTIVKLSGEIGIFKHELEGNIVEIKYKTNIKKRGGAGGKSIINPKLPIIVNEDFAEMLGHLCGDGTLSTTKPHKGLKFAYINSELTLIDYFKELMINIFGDIKPCVIVRNGPTYTKDNYVLQYPSIISTFILSVYNYKPNPDVFIPSFIFETSKLSKARFLRALFDDEGTVNIGKKRRVVIGLLPKQFIVGIKKLLEEFDINSGGIYTFKNRTFHRIAIADQNSLYKFSELIGFKHPDKKERLMQVLSRGWKFQRFHNEQGKEKIFNLLNKYGNLYEKEIAKFLNRNQTTINEHLRKLQREKTVRCVKEKTIINNRKIYQNCWYVNKNEQES